MVIGKTGDIKPKDVQKTILFVKKNRDVLIDIWELKVRCGLQKG